MHIDHMIQDGELFWTALHRAARLNDLVVARALLEAGANPNLRVRTVDAPLGDCHGAYDSWMQAQCYRGLTSLGLARDIFRSGQDFSEMRKLLRSFGAERQAQRES